MLRDLLVAALASAAILAAAIMATAGPSAFIPAMAIGLAAVVGVAVYLTVTGDDF